MALGSRSTAGAVSAILSVASAAMVLVFVVALVPQASHILGLAVPAAVLDLITSLFAVLLSADSTERRRKSQSMPLFAIILAAMIGSSSIFSTLATLIWIQIDWSELADTFFHNYSTALLSAEYAVWAVSTLARCIFITLLIRGRRGVGLGKSADSSPLQVAPKSWRTVSQKRGPGSLFPLPSTPILSAAACTHPHSHLAWHAFPTPRLSTEHSRDGERTLSLGQVSLTSQPTPPRPFMPAFGDLRSLEHERHDLTPIPGSRPSSFGNLLQEFEKECPPPPPIPKHRPTSPTAPKKALPHMVRSSSVSSYMSMPRRSATMAESSLANLKDSPMSIRLFSDEDSPRSIKSSRAIEYDRHHNAYFASGTSMRPKGAKAKTRKRSVSLPGSVDGANVHPLFRLDAEEDPPRHTSGTSILASPLGGRSVTQQEVRSLSRESSRNSRPGSSHRTAHIRQPSFEIRPLNVVPRERVGSAGSGWASSGNSVGVEPPSRGGYGPTASVASGS